MENGEIKGRECIHARYSLANDGSKDDILLVKEKIHYKDGRIEPNIRIIKNYKQDFYITKEGFRNHEQKKEFEELSRVNKFSSTKANLANAICKSLKRPLGTSLRYLNNSPFVYGTDITTEKLVKYKYSKKWPDCVSEWSLAIMDYETDVLHGTETIISGSITYKDKVVLCYRTDFLNGSTETVEHIRHKFDTLLGKYKKERNIDLKIIPVENDLKIVHVLTRYAHKWNPDIVGFWNMVFDMDKMIDTIKAHGMHPSDFFCHPNLEEKYKNFRWKKKDPKKETISGKKKSIFNEELWHKAIHPAGFYFIDLMSLFCNIRMASGKRESYALDSILKAELNLTKLKFKEADHLEGLKWHQFMQSKYKIEYLIYNIFDCISVELLDEKNNDVSQTLPALLGFSDVNTFDSNPRKLADGLHFYCLENNKVIGSTGEDMTEETDKLQLDKSQWIVTLASHLIKTGAGLNIINEDPSITSNLYALVADLDIEGSYPTTEIILNVSKETTRRELCKIKGVSEFTQRSSGLDMTNAFGNAVQISHNVLKTPTLDSMLDIFDNSN